ncbi:MAG: manganese efflux pump MntP family protein [Christensenellales bacterium]|jgi:putative Mn2+ efflux pump MntP
MALEIILPTAFALAMDAVAVSIANGMCIVGPRTKKALTIALFFGIAQGIMPILGYLVGSLMKDLIQSIDHWVALVLLSFIGIRMIVEAVRRIKSPDTCPPPRELTTKTVFVQAIATSIDALAVGISFAALGYNILLASAVISGTTFVCCLLAVYIGRLFSITLKEKAEILGGIVLIIIALRIVIEHLSTGI